MTETLAGRRWLFVVTILTGSFLLFLVQPMVARMALPRLGGAPNVWNSAMLVYQALLLGGYAYAHALSRLPIGRQAAIHIALLLLAAVTLPITLPDIAAPAPGREALWVPWLFLLTVGPLFFVVSAQAPLMQRWFVASPAAGDPYPLYAASNLGSFAGLLAYPLLAEPLLSIGVQSRIWAIGYALLILLVAAAALSRRGATAIVGDAATQDSPAETDPDRPFLWIALSAVPSGLMLSTTTYLTTDIFAMPLLWVIPLGLYLLSFSVAFATWRRPANAIVAIAPFVLVTAGGFALFMSSLANLWAAAASILLLFVVSVALHTRLYETRPAPARLTRFYLYMSAGGALGGLFTALIAPLVFDWTWEHPLLIIAAAMLVPLGGWSRLLQRSFPSSDAFRLAILALLVIVLVAAFRFRGEMISDPWTLATLFFAVLTVAAGTLLAARRWSYVLACVAVLALLGGISQLSASLSGNRSRSYFGIYTVKDTAGGFRLLVHGTTNHGAQRQDPKREFEPTTYYSQTSGAGLAMLSAERLFGPDARIGVVGLGVGTLACYRRPGQTWTYFEIDPEVLAFSKNGSFTYLQHCTPDAQVVLGDARLKLQSVPKDSFDILVVDAFSSDAIPLHLMTDEAQKIYLDALAPNGLLMMHITNRFVKLEPVLAALARENGLTAMKRVDDHRAGAWPVASSWWVALSRDPATIAGLEGMPGKWRPLETPAPEPWTDDYASILPYLDWKRAF
jgi:hypothetical protein